MGVHDRDWYRDWWRKKTGYVERASFRMGDHEVRRALHRASWRRNLLFLVAVVLGIVLLAVLR